MITMVPGWRPLNDRHAILDMHIVVELNRAASQLELVALLNAKDRLPGLADASVSRGFPLSFGMQMPLFDAKRRPPVMEVNLDRYKDDATVAERVAVNGRSLVYLTSDYTRWTEVSSRATRLLETALDVIGNPAPLTLTVRYLDLFLGEAVDGQVPHPSDLFRAKNLLVVPMAANSGDYFHSHTGFFRTLESGHKALLNCDIEFSGTDEGKSLSVMTSVKIFVEGGDAPVGNGISRLPLHNLADMAHMVCKEVIHQLMADEVSDRIGLKVP